LNSIVLWLRKFTDLIKLTMKVNTPILDNICKDYWEKLTKKATSISLLKIAKISANSLTKTKKKLIR
jgi:hypothetical protein